MNTGEANAVRGPWYPLHAGLVRMLVGLVIVVVAVVGEFEDVIGELIRTVRAMLESTGGTGRDWGVMCSTLWDELAASSWIGQYPAILAAGCGVWLLVGKVPRPVLRLLVVSRRAGGAR